jgi:hypothetical protein
VGPDLVRQQENNGFLTVYSATAWMNDSDGPSLLHHTDYEIDAPPAQTSNLVRLPNGQPIGVRAHTGGPKAG